MINPEPKRRWAGNEESGRWRGATGHRVGVGARTSYLTCAHAVLTLKTLLQPLPQPQNLAGLAVKAFLVDQTPGLGGSPVAASLGEAVFPKVAPVGPWSRSQERAALESAAGWGPWGSPTSEGLPLPPSPAQEMATGLLGVRPVSASPGWCQVRFP